MTHTQIPGAAGRRTPVLGERENQRAVDLIEQAERTAPFCLCGRHMLAIAEGNEIWLECSSRNDEKAGLSAVLSRLTSFGHTRRMIMELAPQN